jgi:membrane protease YdiL (CAAX protease family)
MGAENDVKQSETEPIPARALAIWEITSVVTSCLIAEWVVLSFVGSNKLIVSIPILLALALMVTSHRERGETLHDLGFRVDNFLAAIRLLLLPTLAALLVIMAVAWSLNQTVFAGHFRTRFLSLPLWALFQQYALNGFINRRAQLLLGKGTKSVLLVALVFSVLHLPNPVLAILTLLGGLIWATAYQREPNLWALAISHAVASVTVAITISPGFLNNMRVGFKYFG